MNVAVSARCRCVSPAGAGASALNDFDTTRLGHIVEQRDGDIAIGVDIDLKLRHYLPSAMLYSAVVKLVARLWIETRYHLDRISQTLAVDIEHIGKTVEMFFENRSK